MFRRLYSDGSKSIASFPNTMSTQQQQPNSRLDPRNQQPPGASVSSKTMLSHFSNNKKSSNAMQISAPTHGESKSPQKIAILKKAEMNIFGIFFTISPIRCFCYVLSECQKLEILTNRENKMADSNLNRPFCSHNLWEFLTSDILTEHNNSTWSGYISTFWVVLYLLQIFWTKIRRKI